MRALLPLGWFVPVTPGTRFVTVGRRDRRRRPRQEPPRRRQLRQPRRRRSRCTRRRASSRSRPTTDPELFWGTAGGWASPAWSPRRRCGCSRSRRRMIRARQRTVPRPRRRDGAHGRRRRRLPLLGRVDRLPRHAARRSVARCCRGATTRSSTTCRRSCARPAALRPRTRDRRAAVGAERAAQPAERRRVQRALVPRGTGAARAGRDASRRSSTRSTACAAGTASTAAAASSSTSTWCPTTRTDAVRTLDRDAQRRARARRSSRC